MKKWIGLVVQIVKFGIVGVCSTLLDYGLMVALKEGFGVYYLAASTISYGISLVFNYIVSMRYVFMGRQEISRVKEFVVFTTLSLVGMGMNQLILWLIVENLGVDYRISKILATAVVMIWNFVTRKIFLEQKTE